MTIRRVVIVDESKHTFPAGWLDHLTDALEEQLHAYSTAIGSFAYSIVDLARASGWRLVILDNADVAGALGYHDVGPDGKPYSRIFADTVLQNGGTLDQGADSLSAVASHELVEMLGDPGANRWASDAQGILWAYERSDATQGDSYPAKNGIALANFVLDEYFNPWAVHGSRLDFLGLIDKPFAIRPGGYAIRQAGGRISQVFGEEVPDWKQAPKGPGSRTFARLRQDPASIV